jgi:hypothetical protein
MNAADSEESLLMGGITSQDLFKRSQSTIQVARAR